MIIPARRVKLAQIEQEQVSLVISAQAGIPFPWGKVGWGSHLQYGTVL